MNLEPTMKQAVIRRTVRRFAQHKLAPAAVEMDATGRFSVETAGELVQRLIDALKKRKGL